MSPEPQQRTNDDPADVYLRELAEATTLAQHAIYGRTFTNAELEMFTIGFEQAWWACEELYEARGNPRPQHPASTNTEHANDVDTQPLLPLTT